MLELPWPPFTGNTMWRHYRGRTILSPKAKKYRETIWALALEKRWPRYISTVSLHIDAYPPDRRRRDLDNIVKILQDSLQYARILKDDNQIKKLSIEFRPMIKGGKLFVCLEPYSSV